MSRGLIIAAFVFETIGLIWDFIFHLTQHQVNEFFVASRWPIYLGFVLLVVAVVQSMSKKEQPPRFHPPQV